MLPAMVHAEDALDDVTILENGAAAATLQVAEPTRIFTEEERSRAPTIFTVLRAIVALFKSPEDPNLGLYGAYGYDLAFQFDPVEHKLERPDDQRDVVLYLPDEILVVDH
jgi:anthranilate synthase